MNDRKDRDLRRKVWLRFLLPPLALLLFLLLCAGSLRYWQAYLYVGTLSLPMIFAIRYFLKRDPDFLERRMKLREKETTQKLLTSLSTLLYLAGFGAAGLDRRLHWSDPSASVVLLADLAALAGYLFIVHVFRENRYASRIVEVEEQQRVIATGPYRYVRHPMYAGLILLFAATPAALGSFFALLPFAVLLPLLVPRILDEERVLLRHLEGYADYCEKTPFRLIPGIW